MKESMEFLHDRHHGQTLWIVGKGPSLQWLRREDFGAGPVIAINEAILVVQNLPLANPMYGMNKDGCRNERQGHACTMVAPYGDVNMILQGPGFSEYCFPNHPNRFWINPVDELGFQKPTVMSVRMCIALGRWMGCTKIMVMCCDSIVNGDMRVFDGSQVKANGASGHYSATIAHVKDELRGFPHEYILPRQRGQ